MTTRAKIVHQYVNHDADGTESGDVSLNTRVTCDEENILRAYSYAVCWDGRFKIVYDSLEPVELAML